MPWSKLAVACRTVDCTSHGLWRAIWLSTCIEPKRKRADACRSSGWGRSVL